MSGGCSICLSEFTEPVSIPCGHIYCRECLEKYLSATDNDQMTAECPACRKEFSLLTPDMSILPKKFRPYFTPNVRRVYLDTTFVAELEKELKFAKKRIKKVEKDQETLLRQCERHMETARAHAEGEKKANVEIVQLRRQLRQNQVAVVLDKEKDETIANLKADVHDWKSRYCGLFEQRQADLESLVAERDIWKKKYLRLEEEHSAKLDLESDLDDPAPRLRRISLRSQALRSAANNSRAEPPLFMIPDSPDPSPSRAHASFERPLPALREIKPLPGRSRLKLRPRPSTPPTACNRTKRLRRACDNEC